jgi:hypothetical protein
MRTISLKLADILLSVLEREAKVRRVSKSLLVRESLETLLWRRPGRRAATCFDLATGSRRFGQGLAAGPCAKPEIQGRIRGVIEREDRSSAFLRPVWSITNGPNENRFRETPQ